MVLRLAPGAEGAFAGNALNGSRLTPHQLTSATGCHAADAWHRHRSRRDPEIPGCTRDSPSRTGRSIHRRRSFLSDGTHSHTHTPAVAIGSCWSCDFEEGGRGDGEPDISRWRRDGPGDRDRCSRGLLLLAYEHQRVPGECRPPRGSRVQAWLFDHLGEKSSTGQAVVRSDRAGFQARMSDGYNPLALVPHRATPAMDSPCLRSCLSRLASSALLHGMSRSHRVMF